MGSVFGHVYALGSNDNAQRLAAIGVRRASLLDGEEAAR